MSKEKIVVLNSGGFDSTVLLASLCAEEKYEVHSIYFSCGQLNDPMCSRIAERNASELGAIHHVFDLPKFSWTNSNFYDKDINEYHSQYLEMRNLVFISYALSFAESLKAKSIYMAILKGNYADTCAEFIKNIGSICNLVGVDFMTPYKDCEKSDLFYLAKKLSVGDKLPYLSCDTPNNGKPCGVCADCKSLERYTNGILNPTLPVQIFYNNGCDTHDKAFQESFLKYPIEEIRVLLNNDCQLNCKHCYHGGNPLIGDILSDDELVRVIVEAYHLGIKSVHYAGKEPLFDDRIFRITRRVKEALNNAVDIDFTVVTNGINVPKYEKQLKEVGISKVFLSAEDIYTRCGNRPTPNSVIQRALTSLQSAKIPTEIFYDLTSKNIKHTLTNIEYWSEHFGVKDFFVRTLRLVGNNADSRDILSNESICELHEELTEYKRNCNITLNIGACPYTYNLLFGKTGFEDNIIDAIDWCATMGSANITENYSLRAELFCARYESQITLTADGYILGCAMECSVAKYNEVSSGNVRDYTLKELINKGKVQSLEVNKSQCQNSVVYFKKCAFTPID
jgi:7-cyano-7-deazaguanine synthase